MRNKNCLSSLPYLFKKGFLDAYFAQDNVAHILMHKGMNF
jgi:hypothetical protein